MLACDFFTVETVTLRHFSVLSFIGCSGANPAGATTCRAFWAHDRDGERRTSAEFDDMHVYHYATTIRDPIDD